MPTIGGIACKVQWDAYEKGSGRNGPWIRKNFVVDWQDADDFVNVVLGGVAIRGGSGGEIERVLPNTPEESPNLRASEATVRGIREGAADGSIVPTFSEAVVSVVYGMPEWDALPTESDPEGANQLDPDNPIAYAIQEIEASEELIEVATGAYTFEGLPALSVTHQQTIYKHVPRATIRIQRKFVPFLPWGIIRDRLNKVNSEPFLGCEPGTVRFAACSSHREFTSDGKVAQSLDYRFEWRDHPWGQMPRPDDGTFDYVSIGGTPGLSPGVRPYDEADLRTLFTATEWRA